jgi:polyprenyl synthetase
VSEPSAEDRAWAARRRAGVDAAASAVVARHAVDEAQRALLERALGSLRARRTDPALTPSVHLPLLAFGALAGDDSPALALAAATALLELGIDLLDHVADGELGAEWDGLPRALPQLAAAGFLSALPQLALAEVDASAEVMAALQHTLAEGLVAIGAGQQRDLTMTAHGAPSVDDVERAVAGKTGERRALYACLAARLAGARPEVVEGFATMARHLGVALQWSSDVADLLSPGGGRDLVAGTPTLPIVLWMGLQPDGEAARARLRQAQGDPAARAGLARAIASGAPLRGCLLKIEAERARARRALASLRLRAPFGARLALWLDDGW